MDTGSISRLDAVENPDIYYFILDGYTGNMALKKYWNFDNSDFTGSLRALNFKVADSARGNIAATIGALSFVFNLSVFNNPQLYEYNMDLVTIKYIRNNTLFEVLRKNGYSIEGNSLFFDKKPYFFSQGEMHPNATWFSNFITRHLLFRVIFKGVNILLKDTYTDNSWFYGYDKRTDVLIKKQIREAGARSPGFYFNHLMITHPPYFYTHDGKPLGTDEQTKSTHHYLDQVKYTNSLCLGYFTALVNKYRELDKPLVIIAQSDHGSKELKLVEEDSQIQLMIYDSRNRVEITPQEDGINLMRKVLNKHLGYMLPEQPYEYYNLFQQSGRRE